MTALFVHVRDCSHIGNSLGADLPTAVLKDISSFGPLRGLVGKIIINISCTYECINSKANIIISVVAF